MDYNRERDLEDMKQEFDRKNMSGEQVNALKATMRKAKADSRRNRRRNFYRVWGAVAAAIAIFILLPNTSADVAHAMSGIPIIGKLVDVVTFRDYKYQSERNNADVQVPSLVVDKDVIDSTEENGPNEIQSEEKQQNLEKNVEEINAEIQTIANGFLSEFEDNLKYQEGYQDIIVSSEIINTTEDYFTLKLICYQGAGSGTEWNYYYTIDLHTGERLALKDLFVEGADYITPISQDIKRQMREQMEEDEMVHYWLDDEDIPEWNFQTITDETAFYVNENGELVISFNEGDVAPMYMGVVTFTIPSEVTGDIWK